MFIYNKTKTYTPTEDMKDIENYIGSRIPLLLRSRIFDWTGITQDEVIAKLSKFLYFMCVFENVWRDKGATDCRTLPIRNGEFLFTALKGDEVLKQTTLIL
jgi:hypothetical protein